jgi:hypothetical protein
VVAENLFLRRQLTLYLERKNRRCRPTPATKFALVMLSRFFPWESALAIVKPDTFVRWHRAGFRLFWRWKSRYAGRPPLPKNPRTLIMAMAQANPSWGEGRIADELSLKLGLFVDSRTVGKYLKQRGRPRQPSGQRWATFVRNHASDIIRLRLLHLCDRDVSSLVRLCRDRDRFAADPARQCNGSSDFRNGPDSSSVSSWTENPAIDISFTTVTASSQLKLTQH